MSKALGDDYYHFAEGNEFIPKDHLYAMIWIFLEEPLCFNIPTGLLLKWR